MPYKHIAAHLKKTELACRLHYHQLSHGSSRRKRTTSVSSGSSSGHSPVLAAAVPSPIQECMSRSRTPPESTGGYHSSPSAVQLPSIMASTESPRLPAILPKPASMQLNTNVPPSMSYPTPGPDTARSLGPSAFPPAAPLGHGPPLRLDCSLPPPPPSHAVDLPRLHTIYNAHRASFWGAVASDYGAGVSPVVLEQAWRASALAGPAPTPITPTHERDLLYEKQDRTRISAILGIDANPRSPSEREMVRRLEEERNAGVAVSA